MPVTPGTVPIASSASALLTAPTAAGAIACAFICIVTLFCCWPNIGFNRPTDPYERVTA